jgi:hypothetical protein
MIDYIKDRYLTWRTGKDQQTRDWDEWCDKTIVRRANTIENMFMNFNYIITVSTNIFDLDEPFGWCPKKDFQQYLYPNRALGDNAVYYFARGYRDQWDGRFHLNDLRHEQDMVFVATNNEQDAVMMALKYSS